MAETNENRKFVLYYQKINHNDVDIFQFYSVIEFIYYCVYYVYLLLLFIILKIVHNDSYYVSV